MPRILIVEDEADLAGVLKDNLELEGYSVEHARDGKQGLSVARRGSPDVVILDVMLPGLNGFEVCRELRASGFRHPILMLTARGQEADRVRGLDMGADDYVTKPFSILELLARVKALLRRPSYEVKSPSLTIGDTVVDLRSWTVTRSRRTQSLTTHEAKLIELMAGAPGRVFSRDELLDRIWGLDASPTNRTVDNFIVKLRRKIEPKPRAPRHLITVHGTGYKLVL